MAEVVIINQKKAEYQENLFPYESTLNVPFLPTTTSGRSSGEAEYVDDGTIPTFNRRAVIRLIFTGTDTIIWNIGNRLTFTAPHTGSYIISFAIYVPSTYSSASIKGKMVGFVEGSWFDYDFDVSASGFVFGAWNTFTQIIQLTAGDLYETEFKINSDTLGSRIYFGGFQAMFDDRQMGLPPFYREPYNVISNSSVLDFGSISSNDYEDLTIALVGARVGDAVLLGRPILSTEHYFFTAFVSADDVVTVRCLNYGGGSVNPDSGTFNVKIIK